MINHPASLLDVFPELELPENDRASLTQNTVTDMDLHPSRREVSVCIQSSVYLPATLLREIEDQIQKAYLLRDVLQRHGLEIARSLKEELALVLHYGGCGLVKGLEAQVDLVYQVPGLPDGVPDVACSLLCLCS